MGDSETAAVIELQTKIAERLQQLGFTDPAHAALLAHQLAEIAARSKTVHEQAIPLFLTLDARHRHALAEVTMALKNHLDAIQDSISDVQLSLQTFVDFLLATSEENKEAK